LRRSYGFGAIRALRGDLVGAAKCCGLASKLADEIKCEQRTGLAYTIATERIRAGLTDAELASATIAGATMKVEDAALLRNFQLEHPRLHVVNCFNGLSCVRVFLNIG